MSEDKVMMCIVFGGFMTLFTIALLSHFNII